MDTREVAQAFTALLREGKDAGEAFWHEDVSSLEPMGDMKAAHGREAVRAKGAWWVANHEVHGFEVEGPFVNDDQFALRMRIDVTVKATGARMAMTEVGLYTVQDGKVVEERFFY
ncbi:MAG: nuclear transport factor 2 family protein [Rubritepida sp.]|jgi:ketosteroid isomerase-like protein|nr:nuclear transport factor 2 family protein [Rubritepida sp.]